MASYYTSDTWNQWTTTSTTTCTASDTVWVQWVDSASTATTVISSTSMWSGWCSSTNAVQQVPQLTDAQRRAIEVQNEAYRKQAQEQQQKREAAEKRAQELLEANLALQERDRLRKHGHFIVHGRSGCRYRIRKGRSGNVDVINREGIIVDRLCAHPSEFVPDYDTMLAQKLMLESDEDGFNRIANKHGLYQAGERVLEPMH